MNFEFGGNRNNENQGLKGGNENAPKAQSQKPTPPSNPIRSRSFDDSDLLSSSISSNSNSIPDIDEVNPPAESIC